MESALVTGVLGQDGIYLANLLKNRGVRVIGTVHPRSGASQRVGAYLCGIDVVPVDLGDAARLRTVVTETAPEVIFNLAAISSVARSWEHPEETFAVNAEAVEVMVDAALEVQRRGKEVRFVQASTSEVVDGRSPYARSKARAEEVVRAAREQAGLHASTARLHIHDSPLRPATFVSRKISTGVAAIALGRSSTLTLGNLDVVRDWGFAGDYVQALRLMAEHRDPVDLSIGTGVRHTLVDLVRLAFAAVDIADMDRYVVRDPDLARPSDVPEIVADPGPSERVLGWRATVPLEALVRHMVAVDVERLRSGVEESSAYLAPPA